MKKREKKIMEYPDSPSGFVTLYNYKEPFMKYQKGYGFQGVLLFDGETDKVQCHLCGNWYHSLGPHIAKEHNMKAAAYKEEVGLTDRTALIGESMRAKLIASGLNKRLQNLRVHSKHTEESKRKIAASLAENRRQLQNLRGTCPEQLIERMLQKYNQLGRTPTTKEVPAYDAIIKTFGTYKNACEYAGIPYNDPMKTLEIGRKHRKGKALNELKIFVRAFWEKNKRMPSNKDFLADSNGGHRLYEKFRRFRAKKDRNKFLKELMSDDGIYRKVDEHIEYNKEELINFLKMFEKLNKRKPSYSDSKRGLVPGLSNYSYHFGSWKTALSLAFK